MKIPRSFLSLATAVLAAVGLSSCAGNLVKIHYVHQANCHQFRLPDSANPITLTDGMYMIYKIKYIENNDKKAKDFYFETGKVHVDGVASGTSFDPWVKTAQNQKVPKGKTVHDIGRLAVGVIIPGFSKQSYYESRDLSYKSYGSESVLMINDSVGPPSLLNPGTYQNVSQLP